MDATLHFELEEADASGPAAARAAPLAGAQATQPRRIRSFTCPNCLRTCDVGDVLAISRHPDLLGDAVAGKDEPLRFLPSAFDVHGDALDLRGEPCRGLACGHCHLRIVRECLEMPSSTFSMIGAPATGKSYYLAALTWELRKVLAGEFALPFHDADPDVNRWLADAEQSLFLAPNPTEPVRLDKTHAKGAPIYQQVILRGREQELPRPFLFTLRPAESHPRPAAERAKLNRLVVLYDNAGEHFEAGKEADFPAAQHLAQSGALCLLFDPTKDARFRPTIRSRDPQLAEAPIRQETYFREAIHRVRTYRRMGTNDRYKFPVSVIVTKSDVWSDLIPAALPDRPWGTGPTGVSSFLRMDEVDTASLAIRGWLQKSCPDIVDLVEGFASNVRYFGASALGGSPVRTGSDGGLYVRPDQIRPFAVALPLLWIFSQWGLIPFTRGERASEVPHAEDIRGAGDVLNLRIPGTDRRIKVPVAYRGATLTDPESRVTFHLPA